MSRNRLEGGLPSERHGGSAEGAEPVRSRVRGLDAAVTLLAIGPQGWAVAERRIDHPTPLIVADVADQLRAAVRSDTGWTPTVLVLDRSGDDVSSRYPVE